MPKRSPASVHHVGEHSTQPTMEVYARSRAHLGDAAMREEIRIEKAALDRQIAEIWRDVALELLRREAVLQAELGGEFVPIKQLGCSCPAHRVVKARIREQRDAMRKAAE
jgi:hypothetical protein